MAGSNPISQPRVSVAGDALTPRWQALINSLLGAVVAGCVLTAGQAKALVVNVGGQDYDVTIFTGSFNDNASKFNTPGNGGLMPWFGDVNLASSFASAFGNSLLPNFTDPSLATGAGGPFFAYRAFETRGPCSWVGYCGAVEGRVEIHLASGIFGPTGQYEVAVPSGDPTRSWAIIVSGGDTGGGDSSGGGGSSSGGGTPGSAENVPGPLPILGLAAAFGFSRKLRKRIKLHRGSSDISTSPGA